MTVSEIRQRYVDFFRARGHVIVPSARLVPENDPTTLFTGSGMQPMLPYLLGEPHPLGKRIVNSQKSFRAQDIEEVGDNRHTTFFEMLGNWSFGDYFKDEQIPWMFQFLSEELHLDISRLYFTCYAGNDELGIPRDTTSASLWQGLYREKGLEAGIGEEPETYGIREGERIFYYGDDKNWWSRVGAPQHMPEGEPGGPDTEMFFDFGNKGQHEAGAFKDIPCHVNCDCGRFVEIGNNVFMEYVKQEGRFEKLPKPNVDFGAGLERMAMAVAGVDDIFLIDTMQTIITEIAAASGKEYEGDNKVSFRIIADHIRGSTFMLADGVRPGNTDQGYILRRLIRRAIRHLDRLETSGSDASRGTLVTLSERVISAYQGQYPELDANRLAIHDAIHEEEQKFRKTLASGLREFARLTQIRHPMSNLGGEDAFMLFSTYGFPFELTEELAKEKGADISRSEFEEEMKKHQATSRAGAARKFAGGLADHSAQTIRYHTAHHLLLKALQMVLGSEVRQRGSNITSERLRIDFSSPRTMTAEESTEVESIVNQKIAEGIDVIRTDMPREEAEKLGAEHEFGVKYPETVSVYTVGPLEHPFSIEFCGGPHVANTAEIGAGGKKFKIIKEEAVASGIRRIKAVVQ